MKLEILRNIPKEPSEKNHVFWKQGEFFLHLLTFQTPIFI